MIKTDKQEDARTLIDELSDHLKFVVLGTGFAAVYAVLGTISFAEKLKRDYFRARKIPYVEYGNGVGHDDGLMPYYRREK